MKTKYKVNNTKTCLNSVMLIHILSLFEIVKKYIVIQRVNFHFDISFKLSYLKKTKMNLILFKNITLTLVYS
jgi:hypothetical protein